MTSSDVAAEYVGVDVHVKFDDYMSNHSRHIRAAHFMMDDERTTTTDDAGGRMSSH